MRGGSSDPPLARALTLRGPTALESPYSETVWYARDEHRRMSSDAPVDICNTYPSQHTSAQLSPIVTTALFPSAQSSSMLSLRISLWQTRQGEGVIHLATGELLCSTAAHEHRHLAPQLRVKHERSVLRIGRNVGEPAVYQRFKVGIHAAASNPI